MCLYFQTILQAPRTPPAHVPPGHPGLCGPGLLLCLFSEGWAQPSVCVSPGSRRGRVLFAGRGACTRLRHVGVPLG